jgi:hypothetical protein
MPAATSLDAGGLSEADACLDPARKHANLAPLGRESCGVTD